MTHIAPSRTSRAHIPSASTLYCDSERFEMGASPIAMTINSMRLSMTLDPIPTSQSIFPEESAPCSQC